MSAQADGAADRPIRVYDLVAQGSVADGLDVADGRHLDLSLRDLQYLTSTLGVDGLRALCLYLEHLEHVPGPDGRPTLGVPHFSARWLIETSAQVETGRGAVPLGKSAATRGQQAVEDSGLLRPLANPTVPGAGARGRTWRAVLGGRLVLIPGDAGEDQPPSRRGRRRLSAGSRRSPQTRAASDPAAPFPAIRESGGEAVTGFAGSPETANPDSASALVSAAFPDLQEAGLAATSTSQSVVQSLLSDDAGPGLLRSRLLPALMHDRARTEARLYKIFNDPAVAGRASRLLAQLQLPTESTQRPQVLSCYLADVALASRSAADDLAALSVSGTPLLSAARLAERLIVGIVVGLGMRQVAAWGAWLHQVTRPSWSPKPNQTVDLFTTTLLALPLSPADSPGRSSVAPSVSVEPPSHQPPGGTLDPRSASPNLLPVELIERHLDAARRRWPLFGREGTRQATDPVWQSRLVRMYLADLRGSDSEQDRAG